MDLRNELDDLRRDLDSGELRADPAAPAPAASRPFWRVALAVVGAAAAVVALVWFAVPRESAPAGLQFLNQVQVTSVDGVENRPSWSADSRLVAYDSTEDGDLDIV